MKKILKLEQFAYTRDFLIENNLTYSKLVNILMKTGFIIKTEEYNNYEKVKLKLY